MTLCSVASCSIYCCICTLGYSVAGKLLERVIYFSKKLWLFLHFSSRWKIHFIFQSLNTEVILILGRLKFTTLKSLQICFLVPWWVFLTFHTKKSWSDKLVWSSDPKLEIEREKKIVESSMQVTVRCLLLSGRGKYVATGHKNEE